MRKIFMNLQLQVAMVAMLFFCGAGHAQDIPKFLRDVTQGTTPKQIELVHRTYHLAIARELAYRTLVLSRCKSYRESIKSPKFDAFAEEILRDMGSSDPEVLTIFTVIDRLRNAAVQNDLTDDQIDLIREISSSPRYDDLIEYLSFEEAERRIASGFIDINTGEKGPWMAASALYYLRQNKFFPLLLESISPADNALLSRQDLDGLKPSDQTAVEDRYLQKLTTFFENQLESGYLRKKLPEDIKYLLSLYEVLRIDEMIGLAILSEDSEPEKLALCKSKDVTKCIGIEWLKVASATRHQLRDNQYETAANIMHKKFSGLCVTNFEAHGKITTTTPSIYVGKDNGRIDD